MLWICLCSSYGLVILLSGVILIARVFLTGETVFLATLFDDPG